MTRYLREQNEVFGELIEKKNSIDETYLEARISWRENPFQASEISQDILSIFFE